MQQLFLDTNVVIDFLADRKPFSIPAARIFNYSAESKINLFISAVSYSNIYYILRQSLTSKETIKLLDELSELTDIADVTKSIIKKSLKTDFKDFEDAIQYHCALSISTLDAIVTKNTKDFKKSILPVLTPQEAISILQNTGSE